MKHYLRFYIYIVFLLFVSCKNSNPTTVIYDNDTINKVVLLKHPTKNLLFVNAKVNNKPAIFLLDTGATITLLDNNQISYYNLKSEDTGDFFGGIGGINNLMEITNCNGIEINDNFYPIDIKSSNISNVVATINHNNGILITGILGSDFLSKNNVVIDFNKEIFFIKK